MPLSVCFDALLMMIIVLLQLARGIPTSYIFQLYHFLIILKVLSVRLHLFTVVNLIKQVLSVRISLPAGKFLGEEQLKNTLYVSSSKFGRQTS